MTDFGNPFSTRHTRPGAIPYRFPDSVTVGQLVERLRSHKWWGQILGPHGTGKTTLLHSLLPALRDADRQVELFTVHAGQRKLELDAARTSKWNAATQVIVDGYEQLNWLARLRLKRRVPRPRRRPTGHHAPQPRSANGVAGATELRDGHSACRRIDA